MGTDDIAEALEYSEFFRGFDAEDIRRLVGICQAKTYEAGEALFRQGDFGEHLFVVADGQVFLERTVDLGARKGRVTIETLGKGRVLGCWSTLLDEHHTLMSTATCQIQCRVLVFRGADLRRIMMENKAFGFNVLERFCFLLKDRIQAAYGAMDRI